MADPYSSPTPSDFADRAATSRAVADDMAAIFGARRRGDAAAPTVDAIRTTPARARRLALAALAAGGLAAVVGIGVIAGGSAVGGPAIAAADAGPLSGRRPMAKPSASTMVAGPTIAPPFVAPVLVPPPMPEPSVAPVAPARPVAAPIVPGTVARGRDIPAPATEASPSVAIDGVQGECDDAEACLDARLDAAERDIADAYAEASDAGVKARILRGYRDEWVRARSEVDRRPREALRLYGMMTSDLRNLSDDAAVARAPGWR